jgi:tetratricopeptide (TPR) repeat protein
LNMFDMKKILTLLAVVSFPLYLVHAQAFNVESAAGMIKKKNFKKAKEFIDKAFENPQTSNDARMWLNRGKTYVGLWNDTSVNRADYPNAIEIACQSLVNCIEVEPKGRYVEEARFELVNAGVAAFNIGVDAYSKGDYTKAMRHYDLIMRMIPHDTQGNLKRNNVSSSIVNQYIGYASVDMKDYPKAISSFEKLINENYNDPNIYISMSRIYLEKGDTTKALEYIAQGRGLYEDNRALVTEEIKIYLNSGKTDVLIKKFQDALKLDPDNVTFNYFMAILFEQSNKVDEAISAYQNTLKIDNSYIDAHTGLATLYFNKGAEIDKKIKNMDLKEYAKVGEKMEKESVDYLNKALEAFKAARDIKPKDLSVLKNIKIIYVALRQGEEAKKIDQEMKDIIASGGK